MPGLSAAARPLALSVAAWLSSPILLGCAEPDTIELVAVRGCGLEQEFSGLRVRLIGDFAASAGTELLLGPGERGQIPAIDESAATAVAAEGLFGNTVTAIGRSFGITDELARGRVPGVDPDAAILPVYFAAPDSRCELDSADLLAAQAGFAAAAGLEADVLIAGGVDADGGLLADLIHVDLFATTIERVGELPFARQGASVHALGGRRFAVLGGAGAGIVDDGWIEVDLSGQGSVAIGEPRMLDGQPVRVAHHATALALDGRVLIAGGCSEVDATGACALGAALGQTAWLDVHDPTASVALGELAQPRSGAHAIVSTDGVAFVAGGFGPDGVALPTVERQTPGQAWTILHTLADDRSVAGLALLDGGLLVIADRQGSLHWWSEAGSGVLDPSSRAPALEPTFAERPLLALPGERVLVDGWLFAPATASVDPALERVALLDSSSGATPILIADGTAMLIGGAGPSGGSTIARVRPKLDGPHEWIPDLAGPQTDAFVANTPGRATVVVGGLQVDGLGPSDAFAPVHAHVRGFRSGTLRLEFEFEADPDTVAQLVLGHGTHSAVAVALLDGAVVVRRRDASGEVEPLDCALAGVEPNTSVVVELEDHARRLRLTSGEATVADCELSWPSATDMGVSVGFGASGSGSARFFSLRLARR